MPSRRSAMETSMSCPSNHGARTLHRGGSGGTLRVLFPMHGQPYRPGKIDDARVAAAGRRLCLAGGVIGLLGLTGWVTGEAWLTTLVPGQPRMMPNTSIALALAGLAGAIDLRGERRSLWCAMRQLAALVVTVIGIATLVEYGVRR